MSPTFQRTPDFEEIWFNDAYLWQRKAKSRGFMYTRKYYRVRSLVRMALWVPLTTWLFWTYLNMWAVAL